MPKTHRIFIDNCCYHIITRGNQKQNVFRDEGDFLRYLNILKRAKRKYNILIYSYCLMPNHVHLMIELKSQNNMSKFMHWINRGYTAYFNKKYKTCGHLWQGRFKNKPIIKGEYLLHCLEYIEANPLRANIVGNMASYQWSSYKERCLSANKIILDNIRGHLGA